MQRKTAGGNSEHPHPRLHSVRRAPMNRQKTFVCAARAACAANACSGKGLIQKATLPDATRCKMRPPPCFMASAQGASTADDAPHLAKQRRIRRTHVCPACAALISPRDTPPCWPAGWVACARPGPIRPGRTDPERAGHCVRRARQSRQRCPRGCWACRTTRKAGGH